jgi:hypothetical protein
MSAAHLPQWEPPLAGSEVEHLVGALDRLRLTFRWKADGLDARGLTTSVGRSELTLGGLLKHLAFVEDVSFHAKFDDSPPSDLWQDVDWSRVDEGWAFKSATGDSPEALYALWDAAVARGRSTLDRAIRSGGLDQRVHVSMPDGEHASLRRLVCDLIEEYGRHTGHADLLREAVDGRVGEDPPDDWPVPASWRHARQTPRDGSR